jgi:16S rRNA (uracil1498-N3)-methyltransferase
MQLFCNPNISENDTSFNFDKDESRHIVKVLRKKTGDVLHITNGKGWLFEGELILANIKNCSVNITSKVLKEQRANKK